MSDKEEKKESKDPSLLKAFTVEAKDRCFSAKDRWLKVLGIIFIPFIYGFVCIAAFWNPLAKIGSIPMSIASLDQEKVLVQDYDTSNNPMDDVNGESKGMCLGIPEMWSDALPNTENINFTQHFPENLTLDEYKTWGESHVVASVLTEGGSVLDYSHTISSYNGNVQSISFMDSMMTNWQNGDMSDIFKFNSKQNLYEADINESLKISNIKYHNVNNTGAQPNVPFDHDADKYASYDSTNGWDIKNNTDYGQISIPNNFTELLINYVDASITQNIPAESFMVELQQEKINFFLTYEKSWFAARMMDSQSQTLTAVLDKAAPSLISSLAGVSLTNAAKTIANYNIDWNPADPHPGYSWLYTGDDIDISMPEWYDHNFIFHDNTNIDTIKEITEPATILHFSKGNIYTIPNEEYREALKAAIVGDLSDSNKQIIYNKINEKRQSSETQYNVPSIEGVTTIDKTDVGSRHSWNTPTNDDPINTNSTTALVPQITRVTGVLSEIPFFSNAISTAINGLANSRITTVFKEGDLSGYLRTDISASAITTLFSSDQFMSSIMMQDPRYMMADKNVPDAAILKLKITPSIGQPIDINASFNFGGVWALLCYPPSQTPGGQNGFQQANIISGYSADKDSYYNNFTEYALPFIGDTGLTKSLASDLFYGEKLINIITISLPDIEKYPSHANNRVDLPTKVAEGYGLINNLISNSQSISQVVMNSYAAVNTDNYIDNYKVGADNAYYGMGLGQYFVCIGLFMGVLTQTMVYDKKKRVRKIGCKKWYISKTMLMACTTVVQASIFAAAIAAIGWSSIGGAFAYQFLAMLYFGLIFVAIIQSFNYWFRDREIGFFVCIVFVILNLAAGWGTFPAYMQFPFFHAISYVLPFTYMIHMQGAIVYGIGTGTHVFAASMDILKYAGILLIYPVIFFTLGLIMSKFRERDLLYGTWNRLKLGNVLHRMGLNKYLDHDDIKAKIEKRYAKNKKKHAGHKRLLAHDKWIHDHDLRRLSKRHPMASWKRLPHEEMMNIKQHVELIYPFKGRPNKMASPELIRDIVDFDDN